MSTVQIPTKPTPPYPEHDAIGRAALRKASFRLFPLLGLGYLIAYMDRVNISFAALQMNQDLRFSASAYGLGAGLFFLSYAVCEVPSNLLLVRFGARRWLARIMLTWGLLSIAMVFVRTPREFYAIRLGLGAAEAGFFPGIIFYLSQWFPVAKRSQAISRFYIAIPLSSVVMGSLAGMLLSLNGRLSLAGWQWLFLLEGLPAIVMSVLFLLWLPDGPRTARWLSPSERDWIIGKLQAERGGDAAPERNSIRRAFAEPRVWLLGLFLFCLCVSWYGYTFIAPDLIQRVTGLSVTKVGFAFAIFGVLGAGAMLLSGWLSDRARERYFHTLVPTVVFVAAFLALAFATQSASALVASALIFMAAMATQPPVWSLPSAFLNGKSAAVGIAAVNTMSIFGGFIGPWWVGRARDLTGNYHRGLLILTIPLIAAVGVMLLIRQRSKSEAAVYDSIQANEA